MFPTAAVTLALVCLPPTAIPGGVEKLIDALVEIKEVQQIPYSEFTDERIQRIHRLGFDAIPTLIKHLDDNRATKSWSGSLNNFRGYRYSVKHFARDLLNGYIEDSGGGFEQLRGDELTKKDAEKWWAEAKKLGEEKYLLQNLTGWEDDGRNIRTHLLRVIEAKYPEKLPDAFAAALKAGEGELHYQPLTDAVVGSQLTVKTKKRLMHDLYSKSSWDGKACALRGLHRLDADDFHKRLIDTLGELPNHPKKPERSFAPDDDEWPFRGFVTFAGTASLTPDPKVWAAVGKYLGRASVRVRMQWIDALAWDVESEEKKTAITFRQIDLLVSLLTDASAHERKYGVGVETTEVRNHVAKRLAEALRMKTAPADNWIDDDWKKFREQVAKAAKEAMKREK